MGGLIVSWFDGGRIDLPYPVKIIELLPSLSEEN